MKYPTIEEVNQADIIQLLRWWRYLPSPGSEYIGAEKEIFENGMKKEAEIIDIIGERMKELGGITSQVSKVVGWNG